MQENREKNEPNLKIAIFTLDSYASIKGLERLIDKLGGNVVLIGSSKRFGGRYGSFLNQLFKNYRRSGFSFVNFQTVNLISYKIITPIKGFFELVFKGRTSSMTLNALARKSGIPIIYSSDFSEASIVEKIREVKPDVLVSFYCDQVIKNVIIKLPTKGVINVHSALLPNCKGPFPILCSALKDRPGGITVHFIENESLDTGPIILQEKYQIDKNRSLLGLERDVMVRAADLIVMSLKLIQEGRVDKKPQGKGDYLSFPTRDDLKLLKHKGFSLINIKDLLA